MLEQLGDRHPFIDLERLGIYGHSGGGFMSTAAMLVCESPGSLQSLRCLRCVLLSLCRSTEVVLAAAGY